MENRAEWHGVAPKPDEVERPWRNCSSNKVYFRVIAMQMEDSVRVIAVKMDPDVVKIVFSVIGRSALLMFVPSELTIMVGLLALLMFANAHY